MSKELPYFRFTPQQWQNGDISLESHATKGLFVDICSYYWLKNCDLTLDKLTTKVSKWTQKSRQKANIRLEVLAECGAIHIVGDEVRIVFLDCQLADILNKSHKLSEAGKKGVEAREKKKQARHKPPLSIKDKDKDKDKDNYNIVGEVVGVFNSICGTAYKSTSKKTKELIQARQNEGFGIVEFQTVIRKKHREWGKTDMVKYLRPETLFGTKFESYLNQPDVIPERKLQGYKTAVEKQEDEWEKTFQSVIDSKKGGNSGLLQR